MKLIGFIKEYNNVKEAMSLVDVLSLGATTTTSNDSERLSII